MSRSSLRYRTATFPRSPAKFSSMVNIRSSLKLHRRSKTQGDTEAGQGDTLPRTPVPITTNIEEEEEEENEAIRAEVKASEAKKQDSSHESASSVKVAQEVIIAVSQEDGNSFHGDEGRTVEEKEEIDKDYINDVDDSKSEEIVTENDPEDKDQEDINSQTNHILENEKVEEEDLVSADRKNVQDQEETAASETCVTLINGNTNGHKQEVAEDSEDESVEEPSIGATLLDDDNLSALRPVVSVTRHSSTISNELAILAEEEEESEEEVGGRISFTNRESSVSNPFDGLDDGREEVGSLSKASSKRSVHFDHGEFIFTNGKANGMLESHFGYDDKKNPFMDSFDDS